MRRIPLRLGIGAGVILLVLVSIVVFTTVFHPSAPNVTPTSTPRSQISINCAIGSEKADLMNDTQVQKLLADRDGIRVNFQSMGSIDQVSLSTDELRNRNLDCLWPSSAAAQQVFEAKHPTKEFPDYRAENILTSPEVIYAGPDGTDVLMKAGIVEKRGNSYYIIKMKDLLVNYVLKGKHWEDLGTQAIQGPIAIGSTNPAQSNSGFTMYMLQLIIVATNDPYKTPSLTEAKSVLPTIRRLYDAQGLQAKSSSYGFDQWLIEGGELRSPLYASYENLIIQRVVQSPQDAAQLSQNVRILYPDPTVYNEHPILALDKNGQRLIDAMKDKDIQTIAWKKFGFRSIVFGVTNIGNFSQLPLADKFHITNVPGADVILALNNCLKNNVCR